MSGSINFSDTLPGTSETVKFPQTIPNAPPPKVAFTNSLPGASETIPTGSQFPPNIPKELIPDIQTLQQFMAGQRNGANINPQTVGQPAAPTPMGQLGGRGGGTPRVPGAAGGMPDMQGLGSLPKPQQAVVMGALGRLLTAASTRIGGGVAGAAAAPTAANAQEPAALAKMGLGTGADRVKMPDWDKPVKPFGVGGKPPPVADAKPPVKPVEPVVAPVPKKTEDKPAAKPDAPTPTKAATKPNFERAFAAAVKDPAKPKVFEWNGKKYKVELAQDVKRKGIGALVKNDDGEADKLNAKELARVRSA